MTYSDWKAESPELPQHFCINCNVEISNGNVCKAEECINELKKEEE